MSPVSSSLQHGKGSAGEGFGPGVAVLRAEAATPPGLGEGDRFAPAPRPLPPSYAALDLGTNNCRLLIARRSGGGFRVIDAFSRIVRLGEGLAATGALSEAAMARTIEALRICAGKIGHRRVAFGRYVATEACRRADNCALFLARLREEIGIEIEIISTAEEARLVVTGCAPLLHPRIPYAIVFDIGGGFDRNRLAAPGRAARAGAAAGNSRLGVIALRRRHLYRALRRDRGHADELSRDGRRGRGRADAVREKPPHPTPGPCPPGADAGQLRHGDDAGRRQPCPAALHPRAGRRQHADLRSDRARSRAIWPGSISRAAPPTPASGASAPIWC